jgi:hypothetical protein
MHEVTRSLKNLCTIVFWVKRDKGCGTLLKNKDRKPNVKYANNHRLLSLYIHISKLIYRKIMTRKKLEVELLNNR